MNCVRCSPVHGGDSCVACDDEGLCAFCCENLPCPLLQRIAKAAAGTITSKRAYKFADKPLTSAPTTAALLQRVRLTGETGEKAKAAANGNGHAAARPPAKPAPVAAIPSLTGSTETIETKEGTMQSQKTTTAATVRTCAEEGCDAILAASNIQGRCRKHRRRSHKKGAPANGSAKAASGNGAVHHAPVHAKAAAADHVAIETATSSASNGGNGHAGHANGRALPMAQQRVDLVLSVMPLEEKRRMLESWLAGS